MFQVLEVGPFLFWSRLVFMLAGIWLSAEFLLRLAESSNLSLQHFKQHAFWYVFAFLFSGRLFAIVADYQVYLREPIRIVMVSDGGFTYLGGIIGMGVVLAVVTQGHRSIFLQWLDALIPAAALGMVFAWLGSFFSGDAYGHPTDMLWGVTYDAPNVRYAIPVHPVQLYYALFYFMLNLSSIAAKTPRLRNSAPSRMKSTLVANTGMLKSPR